MGQELRAISQSDNVARRQLFRLYRFQNDLIGLADEGRHAVAAHCQAGMLPLCQTVLYHAAKNCRVNVGHF
jgi:hypothetical protein